ncbi:MAG: M23 family metallopeptidase, partial [Bacteroidales bacterium]|nr:M23 family metallopeptidase [Bacteroidales bacterium]
MAAMANTSEAQAQDLIARQAPIDRKMKAVDSVVINKAIVRQQPVVEVNYEQTELYTTWDTKTVHCYGKQQTPDRYTIDLRGFAMPTPSKVVTSNFGYRASFGRMHKGLDVKVYIGDTIVSAFDGKVRIVNYEAKGYGNYVVIRHNNGLETIYGHLSKHLCKTGDVVKAGQPIGLGGNTGRSTGSHLHFETRILGEAINPALLFDFVHQDVTCDFYEYRRNGGGGAVASKPKSNPAPVAKAAPAKPAASAPAKAPAKSSAPAP